MSNLLETFEILDSPPERDQGPLVRARDRRDNRMVLLKVPAGTRPHRDQQLRLRREFDLLTSLQAVPGVVRPREILGDSRGDVLVLEHFPGVPLTTWVKTKGTAEIAALAVSLGEALDRVHRKRLVLKALNPATILINPQTGEVVLADFSQASELSREASDRFAPVFEGSPYFLSPEQTGRANRKVDYRSDYYALGMVLYWLATGVHAFETTDLVEMVHCHLAKLPVSPRDYGVPQGFSDIILKLSAKSPEDRYQSMAGFLADLDQFRSGWTAGGVSESFVLGSQDSLDRFTLAQRPYGRESEVGELQAAFARASRGPRELVFVTGDPGIGKTTVVRELYETLTAARSLLLRGKFNQHHRDIPYHALVEALEDGVRQILAGPPDQAADFRNSLRAGLQTNAGVIGALVPGLRDLLGNPPEPPELPPKETESRLFLSFSTLLRILATAVHPVLLFLDDAQWSDPASINLLDHLCRVTELSHLLFVFSYRDNDELEAAPFRLFADQAAVTVPVTGIHLNPLGIPALGSLLGDTLRCTPAAADPLARLVHSRTKGNPFFVSQLLTTCHGEGLISYNLRTQAWDWDLGGIEALGFSDDVLGLLSASIRKLPAGAAACLKYAACLGYQFRYRDLLTFTGEIGSLGESLLFLLEREYLVPLDSDYAFLKYLGSDNGEFNPGFRFLHDRILQTAYGMLDGPALTEAHLRIARAGRDLPDQGLLDLVSHYNQARSLVTEPREQALLARLNHQASHLARASSMFDLAFRLLDISRELLETAPADPEFRIQVLLDFAQAAYTVHQVDEAEKACALLLGILDQPLDRARVLRLQADFYNFLSRIPESLEKSREALGCLGIDLPLQPSPEELYGQILAVGALAAAKTAEEIYVLPDLTDESLKMALGILAGFIVPAFMSGNQNLFALSSLTAVKLALENGHCAESAIAFGNYGILLSGMGQYPEALGVSELAIRLNERFQDQKWKAFIHSNYTLFTLPWTKPWAEFADHSRKTIDYGFQTGDLFIMAYQCTYVVAWDETLTLPEAIRSQEKYLGIIQETGQDGAWACGKLATQLWKGLAGRLPDPGSFDEPGFDFQKVVSRLTEQKNFSALAIYHLYSMESLWYFGRFEEALAAGQAADSLAAALAGAAMMAEYCLFSFLVHNSLLDTCPAEDREGHLGRMVQERDRMAGWARSCPENFAGLAAVLGAETLRRTADFTTARDAYRTAFTLLEPSRNRAHKAMAHELAAGLHRDQGGEKIARYLLQEAWEWYGLWGAAGKQRQLEEQNPGVRFGGPTVSTEPVREVGIDQVVDSATLVRATQAISREINREALLRLVLPLMLENAGAQAVWLVLGSGETGRIAASGTSDGKVDVLRDGRSRAGSQVPDAVDSLLAAGAPGFFSDEAETDPRLAADPQVKARHIRSVLAVPLVSRSETLGYWYLENNLLGGAFTPGKLATLQALSVQVAISLDNARMYRELDELNRSLEQRVVRRTEELAEKNRQILSSIEYAALLQRSILPDPAVLNRALPQRFILWKPRDLVGGDLYWFQETPFGFYLAVVDCTGHGVPGAFMTMAAHSSLNQCALDANPSDPAGFLADLNRLTKRTLGQNRSESEADDGFDIGFCAYTAFDDTLHFAGGRIDLVVSRSGKPNLIRGDRTSLGYQTTREHQVFSNHKITPATGLTFYITSDGLTSQLGGEKQLPFGRDRFLTVLEAQGAGALDAQAQAVEAALREYQGDFEQIDDITVVGFQVSQVRKG